MAPMTMTDAAAPRGLKGVIVADTELGDVRGLEGFYHYRQYSAPELAAVRTFEDVWYLLFEGELPTRAARDAYVARIAQARHLPAEVT
ncbi:MAG TPA: citrate/2-methylcitrate synthase, partial [Dongiaceae bacterium]|nr:citrate/2-methylcitrate synthase [Dongiaceae bacterium]